MATTIQTEPSTALGEDAIREAVNRWSEGGAFRLPHLGDKIFIDEIRPRSSYTVRLDTEYEDRAQGRVTVPYAGGALDNFGEPPGAWHLPVPRPNDFVDRTEVRAVPHTETIAMCAGCAGIGRVSCTACNGMGRTTCAFCGGSGFRMSQQPQTTIDTNGQPVTQMVQTSTPCTCAGGSNVCTYCSGNGKKTCASCNGSGHTKSFDQVTIHFRHVHRNEILNATDLPDHYVGAAKGEVVVDGRLLDSVPPVAAEADEKIGEWVHKARTVDDRSTRLLFQHLHVERVPIHEVVYRYAGQTRQLWVYGTEQAVYAPGAPWRWKQALGLVLGLVGAVVGFIVIGVLLAR